MLMRGDFATRMSGYAIARQNGWMSANEIRVLEDMNKIPAEEGGDLYLLNGNMISAVAANNGGAKNEIEGGANGQYGQSFGEKNDYT